MTRNHTKQMIDIATAWAGRDLAITSLRLRTPDGRTWEIEPICTGGFRLWEIDLDCREGPTKRETGIGRQSNWTADDLLIYLDEVGQRDSPTTGNGRETPRTENTMTKTPTDTEWQVEYAKRSLASIADDAKADIRAKMDSIRRALDEAERRLDANEMPNTCGILQGRAFELEMALARFAAMRDAKPAIAILTNAIDALAAAKTEAR